jgi:hypothetical protein
LPLTAFIRVCACVLAVAAISACKSDKAVGPSGECTASTTSVTLTVTAGTTPTFDWTPACPAYLFLVETKSSGADQWVIADNSGDSTTAANTIHPPLVYGVQPTGTTQNDSGPQTLVAGTEYTVAVWRIMSSEQAAQKCRGQIGPLCLMAVAFMTP